MWIFIVICSLFPISYGQNVTMCGTYPTCEICIANNPCGWCSVPVEYSDGTYGPHCAGKPTDPNNPPPGYKPWTCAKDYQNQACYGYICDADYECVSSGSPGRGVPLAQCLSQCFPPTYSCNSTTFICYQVPPGHGTDKPDCEKMCVPTPTSSTTSTTGPVEEYACNNNFTCELSNNGGVPKDQCELSCYHNVTPIFILGNWRGLEVNMRYTKGEWRMIVDDTGIATIIEPSGRVWEQGTVYSKLNELWLVTPRGIRRGLFSLNQLPEVQSLTWALGAYGAPAPNNWDDAMAYATTFTFAKCLESRNCNFAAFNLPGFLQKRSSMKKNQLPPTNDPCSVFPDCHSCIMAPENCGWCSVPVTYENNTIHGTNCAGTNTTISPRMNCTGTFSTVDCTIPTTTGSTTGSTTGGDNKYYCDPVNVQCVESVNGTLPITDCNSQCKPGPVPPILVNRYFRGLQINMEYSQGEWRLRFLDNNAFYLVKPNGQVIEGKINTVSQYIILFLTTGEKIFTIWQIEQGPVTNYFSWAWGNNGQPPASFDQAMNTNGQTEYYFVSCLDGQPKSVCDFSSN